MRIRMILLLAGGVCTAAPTFAQEADESERPIAAWNTSTAANESDGSIGERGAAVFNNWCAACHSRNPLNSGTASLAVKYNGTVPAALEDRDDLAPEAIRVFVRNGVAMMPGFRKVEISDDDLDALVNYLTEQE